MTKLFLSNKCGYTAGIYGCSNEYFNYTVITGKKVSTFTIYGMYGAEERVSGRLKELGYTEQYNTCNTYGKLTRKDILQVNSEYTAIENIKELIKAGYLSDKYFASFKTK